MLHWLRVSREGVCEVTFPLGSECREEPASEEQDEEKPNPTPTAQRP